MSNYVDLEILEDGIFKYSLKDNEEIISLIEEHSGSFISDWSPWTANNEYTFGEQKRLYLESSENDDNPLKKKLISLSNFINAAAEDYSIRRGIDIGFLTPLTVSKYHTGKTMGYHVDSYGDADPEPTISVVLYLNSDYEGGELHFSEFDIKVKPERYTLVIFPSKEPYFHSSLPLISGTKYLMPGFFYKEKK